MEHDGYYLMPAVVAPEFVARLHDDLPVHQDRCRAMRERNGLDSAFDGSAHHVLGCLDAFHEFLTHDFYDHLITAYFGGPFILNSFGAIDNRPVGEHSYAHGSRFHRDVRTYSHPFKLMLNVLVMLDDFTVENGATKLVPGSHRIERRPGDDELERRCVRAVGPAGSVVLFDSNLWHSAAPNLGAAARRALTLTFTRPFMKQQLDYPRLFEDKNLTNARLRQILGFNARVPENLDQWFQPPESRKYQSGQG